MNEYRILSIDPGSDQLGLALSQIDAQYNWHLLGTLGLDASRVLSIHMLYQDLAERHGARFARIQALGELFRRELTLIDPDHVISESPFMHVKSHAYSALVEVLHMLKTNCFEYNPFICFETIAPLLAKKTIGMAGKDAGDKESIRTRLAEDLYSDPFVYINDEFDIYAVNEHEIDAILVGYHYFKSHF